MGKMKIRSWLAFIVYVAVFISAYVWATFKINAPFSTFAIWFTTGFGLYLGKRVTQRHKKFNNYHED